MSIQHPGERQAEAITEAKKLVHQALLAGNELRDILHDLQRHLATVKATDDDPALKKFADRVEDLGFTLSGMSLGALTIQAGNTLDEAWRRLP